MPPLPAARMNDTVLYTCIHVALGVPQPVMGFIIAADTVSFHDGLVAARMGDQVALMCPFCLTGVITSGSMFNHGSNGLPFARATDVVVGPGGSGTINLGSPVYFSD